MADLSARLNRLQTEAERLGDSLLTVHYLDGKTVRVSGGGAIDLVLSQPDKISRVTATGNRNGVLHTLLSDLIND